MTYRESILAAIRGEVPERLPWVPRLEFWHRARLRQGTLPAELRSLSLTEITERLGVGCYASVADFTAVSAETDMIDRTLGLFNVPALPYRLTLDGVDRRVTRHGNETVVEYRTPVGSVRTASIFTDEMLDAGASISWITEHAIRQPQDFETVGYIFSHLKVEPNVSGYLARRAQVGERGVVVGYLQGTAGPIHHIMKELMPLEQFFYALHDFPEKVLGLAEQIAPYFQHICAIGADSPAEVVLLGGNYDDSITHPRFFEKYILPGLHECAELMHGRGKFLMTHTDGENLRLFPLYRQAAFDIADSVCPYPMTRCTLEEIRENFGDRVTIWGGIPSTLLCADSTTEDEFRRAVDAIIARFRHQSRFILGVSDMVTADCEWDRLEYITDRVANS